MPVFSYKTVDSPVEGIYKEKGSKFLAFGYPVNSEAEIKEKLTVLRKKYFDARHHCYAWMLGADKNHFRANDDGEPNHSAGDPILGQIRSAGLTDVLVVVVRYFGGVKLGVGGLITAYRTAAEDALSKAIIIEKDVAENLTLVCTYPSNPEVMRLVKEFDLRILEQNFGDECRFRFEYKLSDKEQLFEKIKLLTLTGVGLKIE
jgi:uncharacterized YigZ family protein